MQFTTPPLCMQPWDCTFLLALLFCDTLLCDETLYRTFVSPDVGKFQIVPLFLILPLMRAPYGVPLEIHLN